jgi:hypothetical protein
LWNEQSAERKNVIEQRAAKTAIIVATRTMSRSFCRLFFSNLRRGISGVYHHVSKQHLHRYLSEFDFRFNAREMFDSDRREAALKGFSGKRLMLKDPTGKQTG